MSEGRLTMPWRDRLVRVYRRWLPAILTGTAVINLLVVPFLPAMGRPVRIHVSSDLADLVATEGISLDRRFRFYLELGEVAAGATLYAPPGSFVSEELVDGFAGMTLVEGPFETEMIETPDDPPLGVVETPDDDLPYWILPGDSDEWWLIVTDGAVLVVPTSPIDAQAGGG